MKETLDELPDELPDKMPITLTARIKNRIPSKKLLFALIPLVLIIVFILFGPLLRKEPMLLGKRGLWGRTTCAEEGPTMLTYPPIALQNILLIEPMGSCADSHVTPVDHGYWHLANDSTENRVENNQRFEVVAPADGTIVYVGHLTEWITDNPGNMPDEYHEDYDIAIEHSCTLSTYMIHIDTLREDILEQARFKVQNLEGHEHASVSIPVQAGEVIGTVSGWMFDFSVHDAKAPLPGFVFPEHYKDLRHKVYSVDPFSYYEEPLRSQLLEKVVRKAEPRAGKIDFDIEGRLVGNWFKENTNYYKGVDKERYWENQMAITYDYLLPDIIRICIGDYQGKSEAFGVKGNSPDPKDISIETGPVKYELYRYHYTDGEQYWTGNTIPDNLQLVESSAAVGTVMFEVLEDNRLKMEIFSGKIQEQVTGFTQAARIYER